MIRVRGEKTPLKLKTSSEIYLSDVKPLIGRPSPIGCYHGSI